MSQDAGIPVIDISTPSDEVAEKVLLAASTHGFLFIKNDGITIPPKDIDDMFALSREFFSLPKEQKSEYAIHSAKAGGKNRGWVNMQGESLDPEGQKQGDPKEAFNIAPPYPTLQPLPSPLATHADLISRFQTSCHTLCTQLLTLLGTALLTPDPTWFASRHDQSAGPSGTIFRLLYYPQTTSNQDDADNDNDSATCIRAGAHSDYGSLTLLFRLPGQAGLEVLAPPGVPASAQKWAPVPVNPSPETLAHAPILVNIGDLLSFWTRGMLKSTVHRVTFSGGEERYSMAYFCHPLDSAWLESVPSTIVEEYGGKGERELEAQRAKIGWDAEKGDVLTAREHLDRRLDVTYGLKG